MKWVSALSKQTDIDAAVQEAIEEIIRQLEGEEADLTIIFLSLIHISEPTRPY